MTDMSLSPFEGADEFGGLDHLVLPGQDPALLHRIHAELTAELQPGNFIERMWVRDVAIQAVRTEYALMAERAVQWHIHRDARQEATEAPADDQPLRAEERALAKAHIEHVALITQLLAIVNGLIHQRDRLIHQYDGRSGIVKAYQDALQLAEQQALG